MRSTQKLGCAPSNSFKRAHLVTTTKARGNGARLCAEHQPQRHGEATRFGTIRRLWASALAAAGPSDTAAVRWWFQDAPRSSQAPRNRLHPGAPVPILRALSERKLTFYASPKRH